MTCVPVYQLKEYIRHEIFPEKRKVSLKKIIRRVRKNREANFLFWYRVSYVLHRKDTFGAKGLSKLINNRLRFKYGCDIHRQSEIDIGFHVAHPTGIVVHQKVRIGKNFLIRQNTTIGAKSKAINDHTGLVATIGNNVSVGANSCIIGDDLKIGDDVTIAAMTFVNKDVPSSVTVMNKRTVDYTSQRL